MKNLFFCFFLIVAPLFSQQPFECEREWGTYLGGDDTRINATTLDSEGNIWLAGYTSDPLHFAAITTPDAHQTSYGGGEYDGFIAKFSSGGELLYASYFGGEGLDHINDIAVKGGMVAVAGVTVSTSGIATPGAFQEDFTLVQDPYSGWEYYQAGFAALMDTSGQVQWATYYHGDRSTHLLETAIDNDNNIYLSGHSNSSNMATPGAFKEEIPDPFYVMTLPDGTEVYAAPDYPLLAKFTENGNREWATYYGADITLANNFAYTSESIVTDAQNRAYIAGRTNDTEGYFATADGHQTSNGGNSDIYIGIFSPSGAREYGSYYGGQNSDNVPSMYMDGNNHLYLIGRTSSSNNIATSGTYNTVYSGSSDHFLVKFDENLNRQWGTYLGVATNIFGPSVFADTDGTVYAFGVTPGASGVTTEGAHQPEPGGIDDTYIMIFNSEGTEKLYGTFYGGSHIDINAFGSGSILASSDNSVFYISGYTRSPNNIATVNGFQPAPLGEDNPTNGFLAKFKRIGYVGISDNTVSNFSVYPNPNSGSFIIEGSVHSAKLNIKLYDIRGRKVYEETVFPEQDYFKHHSPLTSLLASGLYLLKLVSENKTLDTFKIVVR